MAPLVEGGDVVQGKSGPTEYGTIQRVDGPVVLAVDTEGRIELRLFDDDVREAGFFGLTNINRRSFLTTSSLLL